MRKVFTFGLIAMALVALIAAAAFSGENCTAKSASAQGTMQKASATASACCPEVAAKECAGKMGISEQECFDLCKSGKLTMVNMSVKGMTCGGCEKTVTAALETVPGVVKVIKVNHTDGMASVYFDTRKGKDAQIIKAVSAKGYETQIIPAVAKVTETSASMAGHPGCDPAACAAKGKTGCDMTKKAKADSDSK